MSDEPNQPTPTQPEEKPVEPSAIAPPAITPSTVAPPVIPQTKTDEPKDFTRGLVNPMRFILAFGILVLGASLVIVPPLFWDDYWEEDLWKGGLPIILTIGFGLLAMLNTTPQNVLTMFRCTVAFGIPVLGGLALVIPRFFWDDWNWREVWMVILLVCCGLFAVMSVMVIIGGAFDVRKLLRRLREQETGGEPDTSE
ncbi:MAG TPA: hypothetical protein DGJ56_06545 [Verrucomicrobiales bacterium]|nr:hypothetical protein [Verrucomicrobiales bacterium]